MSRACERVREALAHGSLPTPGDVLTVMMQAEALYICSPQAAQAIEIGPS